MLGTAESNDVLGDAGAGARPSFTVRTVTAYSRQPSSPGVPTSMDVSGCWSCGAGAMAVAPRGSHSGADAYAGAATSHATSAVAHATKRRAQRESISRRVLIARAAKGKRFV